MKIRADQINRFLPLLLYNDHSHFSQVLDVPDESGNLESLGFPIHEKRNLAIGSPERQEAGDGGPFAVHREDRIGFELRDHMVATLSTDFYQCFRPVPTIGQEIEFTGDRQSKPLDKAFGQGDFRLKGATSSRPFRMIEFGPKRQKKILVEQGRDHPLMTEDISHVLGMILMPPTS